MPRRLDFVRFRVGDEEIEVPFTIALELAERAAHAPDDAARSAASRIRGAGASRPVRLSEEELAAFAQVIDVWEAEGDTAPAARAVALSLPTYTPPQGREEASGARPNPGSEPRRLSDGRDRGANRAGGQARRG